MEDKKQTEGARLKHLIYEGDTTQKALADKIHVDHSYISAIIAGKKRLTKRVAHYIGLATSVRPEWLLTGEPPVWKTPEEIASENAQCFGSIGESVNKLYGMSPKKEYAASPEVETVHLPALKLAGEVQADSSARNAPVLFDRTMLKSLGIHPEGKAVYSVGDDSMYPMIRANAFVIIDTSATTFASSGVYALSFGINTILRKVEFEPDGGISLMPENQGFKTLKLSKQDIEQVHIIGRVIWVGQRI